MYLNTCPDCGAHMEWNGDYINPEIRHGERDVCAKAKRGKMRYLFITEEGGCYQGDVVTDNDKLAADNGILTIIDATDMKDYYKGEWKELESWNA